MMWAKQLGRVFKSRWHLMAAALLEENVSAFAIELQERNFAFTKKQR